MRLFAVFAVFCLVYSQIAFAGVNRRNVVTTSAPRTPQIDARVRQMAQQDGMFRPEKYAALIMDARTGEIIHARNADARRYPASLTKMMTLYLLFDAMERGKVSTRSTMLVSRRAAQQPQTNISLKPGERIPVDTAIRALVVRSANDVAVVTAEHLGGSVENFAKQMTAKAHALGMKNTVFKNPHGLPDYNQYTTARDLAKLSIALRRDFPQYYNYFSVRQFSWKRVPYFTHNRVMLRYAGADGIKTGFINMSGFNVATSVRRNGRTLVGIVMGGNNAASRDDRMIALLENAQDMLAARGNQVANLQHRNLPTDLSPPVVAPQPKPVPQPIIADRGIVNAATTPTPVTQSASAVQPPVRVITAAPPAAKVVQPAISTTQAAAPFATMSESNARYTSQPAAAPTLAMSKPMNDVDTNRWGIQVGAFEDRMQAEQAAKKAFAIASPNLQGTRIAVNGAGAANKTIHRARLENLTEDQAKKACQVLISNQSPCFIYRVN